MTKLLLVADDFTGALDTGVRFASFGAETCVVANPECHYASLSELFQVLVVDTESRHMAAADAYSVVHRVVRGAIEAGYTYIYKKTDSALRGNIGAELAAVLDAAGAAQLAFFPAFPQMNRVTRNGIHYIDGVPVAESLFGRDPFEPVRHSAIADIVREQTDIPVVIHRLDEKISNLHTPGIHVFDAVTDNDLDKTALSLEDAGRLNYLAGCAGLAAALPALLKMKAEKRPAPYLSGELLTVCGSVNPVTRRQLDRAEKAGALRIRLTPQQKLDPEWIETWEGKQTVAQWREQIEKTPNAIVECGVDEMAATTNQAEAMGLNLDQARRRISQTIAGILQHLLDMGLERDLLVTGGDTLLAFMSCVGQHTLMPLSEPAPGVVLSRICYKGKNFNLMSKSGGFGPDTLLLDLCDVHRSAAISN